jgi:hypothetical protein
VPFRVDDFIRIQNFNGKNSKYLAGKVTAVTDLSFTIEVLTDTDSYLFADGTDHSLPPSTDFDGGVKYDLQGISGKQLLIVQGNDFEGGATVAVRRKGTTNVRWSTTMAGGDNETKNYYFAITFSGEDELSIYSVNTDGGTITTVQVRGRYNVPEPGDVALQWGNKNDKDRQGLIYLTNSDSGAPYIDVLDGINSGNKRGNYNRVRIGKLSGISDQTGYGIWGSQDGSSTDFVISSDGYAKIANFDFNNNSLTNRIGNKFISFSNSETANAVTNDNGNTYGRRGLTIFNYNDETKSGGFKVARFGQISKKDDPVTFSSTPEYGIQIMTMINGSGQDIFRVDSSGAFFAGWNFNNKSLYKDDGIKLSLGEPHFWNSGWYGLQVGADSKNRIWLGSNGTNYEIACWKNDKYIFRLGSIQNQIAGITLNDSRLYTSAFSLNKDGSVSFAKGKVECKADGSGFVAGGKISWDASGNAKIDGSLITKHINTTYIEGLSLNFKKGKIASFNIDSTSLSNDAISIRYNNIKLAECNSNLPVIEFFKDDYNKQSNRGALICLDTLNNTFSIETSNKYKVDIFSDNRIRILTKEGTINASGIVIDSDVNIAAHAGNINITAGDLRITHGNIRSYNNWYSTTISNTHWTLNINYALNFLIRATGSLDSTIYLPSSDEINNWLGTSTHMFSVAIKVKRNSTRTLTIKPKTSNNLYQWNGGTTSSFNMQKGDYMEFLWDGSAWNATIRAT